jgi:hypothetical protein
MIPIIQINFLLYKMEGSKQEREREREREREEQIKGVGDGA